MKTSDLVHPCKLGPSKSFFAIRSNSYARYTIVDISLSMRIKWPISRALNSMFNYIDILDVNTVQNQISMPQYHEKSYEFPKFKLTEKLLKLESSHALYCIIYTVWVCKTYEKCEVGQVIKLGPIVKIDFSWCCSLLLQQHSWKINLEFSSPITLVTTIKVMSDENSSLLFKKITLTYSLSIYYYEKKFC